MVNSVGIVATAAICAVLAGEAVLNAPEISRAAMAWSQPRSSAGESDATSATAAVAGSTSAKGDVAFVGKARDGHYWAWAEIDGHPVRVLIDTGATAVALTPDDARHAGVDLELLVYNRDVSTAQGVTRAAPVMLDHVSVAGADVSRVEALVVRQGLSTSLLGMSYLGRLEGFEATREGLILHP